MASALAACSSTSTTSSSTTGQGGDSNAGADGPINAADRPFHNDIGDAKAGQAVFRMETFGNETFWTNAVRLPAGIVAAKFTPVDALKAGYNVNIDALDKATQDVIAAELKTDLSPANAPTLNNPATTIALLNANAVIGVVAKDTNKDGKIDILSGDQVGVSCAFCHAGTDASVFSLPKGGTIGKEVDGPTPHNLNVGATFAIAANTRALYPLAQVALKANGGKSIGRAPQGLTGESTEAEFDAYFNNPAFYPVGTFDDQPDATGAPMHITPMFRGDLSAPYGSEGAIAKLDDFSNLVYTVLFDLTNLTTPGGRALLHGLAGPAGDELADTYVQILAATGVNDYPYVKGATMTMPGSEEGPAGIRLDNKKLLDMNAYMESLPAPEGKTGDAAAIERGRQMFRTDCTGCHNVDQSKFVPQMVIPMKTIFPGDNPTVLAMRDPPLNPIEDTPGNIFDDKMVVVNASIFRGDVRGISLPLLIDLARKPVFLHDNSVADLESLLSSSRGADAPHPFYLSTDPERKDMIAFLGSLSAK
ncbi:MAG: hypothetical protein ABI193_01475 [Minicystis sp.]